MKTKRTILGMAGLAAIASPVVIESTSTPATAAYYPWSRQNTNDYGFGGINERYVFGGDRWIDNNIWDPPSQEGADCSGFVSKSWAVPGWQWPNVSSGHPFDTLAWYDSGVAGSVSVGVNSSTLLWMDAWVYDDRRNSNAPGQHMGIAHSVNSNGSWKTWETQSTATGIKISSQSPSNLTTWGTRRFKRDNW